MSNMNLPSAATDYNLGQLLGGAMGGLAATYFKKEENDEIIDLMADEITALKGELTKTFAEFAEKLNDIQKKIDLVIAKIDYMPGGDGYKAAQDDWDEKKSMLTG